MLERIGRMELSDKYYSCRRRECRERERQSQKKRERAMSSIVVCRSNYYRMEAKVVCGCSSRNNLLTDH